MRQSETSWQRADEILDQALDLPLDDRAAFVAARCGADTELRELVERLLARCETGQSGLVAGGALEGTLVDRLGEELEAEYHDLEGQLIGRYRVRSELGRGGMAVVYLAERADGDFEQLVALKLLQPGADRHDILRRFHLEQQILALARHPNIARLLDGGVSDDGRPYIAMEYVEGEAIDSYCDARSLTVRERLALFLEVARAVDYAHRNLVVHRDIKPSNLLVTADGDVKLLDFGIAKLLASDGADVTRTYHRAMTPAFASPEQIAGADITTATDVYQLGVLLYLLLTGCWPYRSGEPSDAGLIVAIAQEPPTRLSTAVGRRRDLRPIPGCKPPTLEAVCSARGTTPARLRRELTGDLDTIVMTALRKRPERRYPSVAQMVSDIERFLEGRTISARPDTVAYRVQTFVRRHAVASATAASAVALVAALVVFYTVKLGLERDRARLEARKATEVSEFLRGLFQVSAPTRSKGEQVTARELLDSGAARIDSELADQPELQADMMTLIGDVYRELGLYDEAEQLLERAISIRRQIPGIDPVELSRSLFALGRVFEQRRQPEPARRYFEQALELREPALGPGHPDVARTWSALGLVAAMEGDLSSARELHERSVRVFESTLGEGHSDYGMAVNRLAVAIQDQREYPESIPLFERAIEVLASSLGEDHPYTIGAKFNLAHSLRYTGQAERADALYREVIPAIERVYGADHPNVATVLNNHANLLRDAGRYAEAEAQLRRALEVWKSSLGPEHPQVAWALNNLGLVERLRGDHDAALKYFARSVEIAEAAYGPDHADVATQLKNFAWELHMTGGSRDAIPLFERAIAIRERVYGVDHSWVGSVVRELGTVYVDLGEFEKAEPLLRRAVALGLRGSDTRFDEVTEPTVMLAQCLAALGRFEEARSVLLAERGAADERGREIVDRTLGELDGWRRANSLAS
jgi:serine/threonine-protein kinase